MTHSTFSKLGYPKSLSQLLESQTFRWGSSSTGKGSPDGGPIEEKTFYMPSGDWAVFYAKYPNDYPKLLGPSSFDGI